MELRINPQKDMMSLFRTPVARFKLPNSEVINPGLEAAIMKRREQDEGMSRSNVRGWHSDRDLQKWPEPEVQELVDSMRSAVLNMVGVISHIKKFKAKVDIAAWANVNGPGSFNQYHTHPECLWSGVYYVRAGEYGEDDVEHPGNLKLYDPRGRVDMYSHPGYGFGKNVNIPPVDGQMILFPSWLAHSVNTFDSDTVRVTIAFNARLLEFAEIREPSPA